MNREIKFRIWYDNQFYYKCLVGNTTNTNDKNWTCPMVWLENKNAKTKRNWLSIVAGSREICPEFYQLSLDTEDYEILYDLIKADLVEKVEDK